MIYCPVCKGEKTVRRINIKLAKTVKKICVNCKGAGFVNTYPEKDGVVTVLEPGILHWFIYQKDKKQLAFVLMILDYVNLSGANHIVAKIINMTSVEESRRKGNIKYILNYIKTWDNARIKFIITSWENSTEDGRLCLLKQGFTHEQNILIWRRDKNGKTKSIECNNRAGKIIEFKSGRVDKVPKRTSEAGAAGVENAT